MKDISENTKIQNLRSHITALEQLLELYEKTALEQTDKLYEEIAKRKLVEEEVLLLQTITKEVAAAEDIQDVFRIVLSKICESTGWIYGEVWLLSQDGKCLECDHVWCKGGEKLEAFGEKSKKFIFEPWIDLPGRVWSSRKPEWRQDAYVDGDFSRFEICKEHNLRAAMGMPVMAYNEVIAVLNFFARETRKEDKRLISLISSIAAQLGVVIKRKQAEQALRDSEEKFRSITTAAFDAIVMMDDEGKISFWNEAAEKMFGYAKEEAMGKILHDLIVPHGYREEFLKGFEKFKETGQGAIMDKILVFPGIRKDGEIFYADHSFSAVKIKDKWHSMSIMRDVTERKLRETRQAAQFALTRIFAESPTWREAIPEILKTVCEGFGWELGELWTVDNATNTLRLESIWYKPPLDASEFEKVSRAMSFLPGVGLPGRVWSSGQPVVWISDVVTDSNFPRASFAKKVGLHGAVAFPLKVKNEITGVIAFFSKRIYSIDDELSNIMADIGKRIGSFLNRKLAEDMLRASEHKYRILLENLPQRIFHKDRDSKYLSCNENYARDLKMKADEIAGKTDYDFYPKEVADKNRAEDKRIMESGHMEEMEEIYSKDGQKFIVQKIKIPLRDEKGNITGIIGTFWDITEHKWMEEQLFHSQNLASVGKLAGGVAHNFNNLLTVIMGYASMLETEIEKDNPLSGYVQKILKSSETATHLIQGLLAFSRKQPANPQPLNLNGIIRETESLLVKLIRENIRLKTVLTEKECVVMADVGQLEQVLMNLATNARDAMPEGGDLVVRTDIFDVDDVFIKAHGYGESGRYVLMSFSDTGVGMDENTKLRIFEPFFTTKEVGKGTGLGLASIYGIVKQYHGYIDVDSAPGKGATFRIYLPLIESEVSGEKADTMPVPKGGTETVLIAEDEEDVRGLVKRVLERNGYKVIEAGDGEHAIHAFLQNQDNVTLLLFDLIMPKKSGKAAYEAIKKMKPDVKVLFMSGYGEDIIGTSDVRRDGFNYITKPVSPMNLLKKVREVLDT